VTSSVNIVSISIIIFILIIIIIIIITIVIVIVIAIAIAIVIVIVIVVAIAIALLGFNDLGSLVTLPFFQKKILFTIISTFSKNEQKNQCGKLKENSRFLSSGHRILPSCGCMAHETMVAKCELVL